MRRGIQRSFWRKNEQIRADTLRVIGPDGKQVGILTREVALKRARELSVDLVEIAPNATPPVTKIVDYTKFLYEQEKKEREQRKKQKKGEQLKEVWFTPFIATNDYEVRLAKVKEFLEEGAKVRITIRPKRRLFDTRPLYTVMGRVLAHLTEIARVEQQPKMLGRQLIGVVTPLKKGKESIHEGKENKNED
ncbi:MAG: translation initiation factor IF-3 [Patescibacteria group bacterium]